MNITDIRKLSAFELSTYAETFSPDSLESAGASFLTGVRDSLVEAVEYAREDGTYSHDDRAEIALESARDSVPVYTHTKWLTFTDLGAYREELDDVPTSLDFVADYALQQIADRLASALADDLDDDSAESDDEDA